MGVLSSSRLAWACSQGSGQRAKLSRPCEACHFASFCWPSQVTRPTQKLQKYAVPLNGKCCNVVWQRGQLQARAGESWPPTIYSTMNYSTPGFPVFTISWSLLKLTSIESVMPPDHLILCRPLHWIELNIFLLKTL